MMSQAEDCRGAVGQGGAREDTLFQEDWPEDQKVGPSQLSGVTGSHWPSIVTPHVTVLRVLAWLKLNTREKSLPPMPSKYLLHHACTGSQTGDK